jgi:hypothetical protein
MAQAIGKGKRRARGGEVDRSRYRLEEEAGKKSGVRADGDVFFFL